MYGLAEIKKGWKNPWLVYSELCQPLVRLNTIYHRRLRGHSGVHVMEEDWDNLLILDGCRYDTFAQMNTLRGQLGSVISGGSSSPEFMKHNFVGRRFPDTIYITANPYVSRLEISDNFYDARQVWKTDWDEEHKTVLPETVAAAARKAHDSAPDKRLVVHFMQPHYPFIGEFGQSIDQSGIFDDSDKADVWMQLRHRIIDEETVRKAYRENLKRVLPHVASLLDDLGGRSVVTADHGNGFGRLGVCGHPHNVYLRGIVEVPWLVTDRGDRRKIVAEETNEGSTDTDSEQLTQRLAHLGYLE